MEQNLVHEQEIKLKSTSNTVTSLS